jgi:hypothetical protein
VFANMMIQLLGKVASSKSDRLTRADSSFGVQITDDSRGARQSNGRVAASRPEATVAK